MKKVFVTGANGYIGSHICLELLKKGYNVCGSVRDEKFNNDLKTGILKNLVDDSKNIQNFKLITIELLDPQEKWDKILEDFDYVIHTASPFPIKNPKNEDELIKPANEGTLNVLRACKKNNIKKVVLTSSVASSIFGQGKIGTFNESDWTDVNSKEVTPYYKSKTLAEKSAWDYAKEHDLKLTTILPALVIGPCIFNRIGTSVELIKKIYNSMFPLFPNVSFEMVDVRDVAKLHVLALENDKSDGKRFLLANGIYSFKNVGQILQSFYRDKKIDKEIIPNWAFRILAFFDTSAKPIVDSLDARLEIDSSKARSLFEWNPISIDISLRDTVESLKNLEIVK